MKGVGQKVTTALPLELEASMIKIKCKAIVFCDQYTMSDTGRNKIFLLSEITTLEGLVSLSLAPNKQLDSAGARGMDCLFYCVFSDGISSGKNQSSFHAVILLKTDNLIYKFLLFLHLLLSCKPL